MILSTGKKRGFVIRGSYWELKEATSWPGTSFRSSENCVRIPESISSWKVLRDKDFSKIEKDAWRKLQELKKQYRIIRRDIRKAEIRFKKTGKTEIPVPLKTIPFNHQVRAFGFASTLDSSGLFMDQGTGKTLTTLAVVGKRFLEGLVSRILVVCPKAVKPVWRKELEKHADYPWCYEKDNAPEGEGAQFWVTNYDRINREKKKILRWKPDMIILDESHKIKNRRASRAKAAITLSKKIKYKMCLTGTPFGKCISEVWSQFNFLNPSIFGSYSQFKDSYLKMGGYMNYKVVGFKNESDFSEKLHSISFRVKKEECLDLPPVSYQKLYVQPDARCKKIYRELDLNFFSDIDGSEVSVDMEASKQIKLRQIVGGLVKADDETLAHVTNTKSHCLRDFLEDRTDDKTVIFFSFTHEIRMVEEICSGLGINFLTLEGATPEDKRDTFEEDFNEGDYQVALIQIMTGAEGLTLVAADTVVFYSPTFSYIGYSQARERLIRIGQMRPVTVVFLIMEETVDERVVEVLECNSQLVDNYLDSNRNYRVGETTMAKETTGYKAADLAAELNITPAELRKHLRAIGAEKPAGGWTWPKKTDASLTALRKQIKERLKEGAKAPAKKAAEKKTPAKKGKPAAKKAAAKPKGSRRRKASAPEGEE